MRHAEDDLTHRFHRADQGQPDRDAHAQRKPGKAVDEAFVAQQSAHYVDSEQVE